MPSVGRDSFLQGNIVCIVQPISLCQCPQSGEPHFYVKRSCSVNFAASGCQCPQSGNPHFYAAQATGKSVPELCQCPQSGNPHFYPASLEPAILAAFRARFCTYFSEYSDN